MGVASKRDKQEQTSEAEELASEGAGAESADSGGLTTKQERALQALLSSRNNQEAVAAADVDESTLWRYMKDDKFKARLREAQRGAMHHAESRLQQLSSTAVNVLEELMVKEDAPAAARISAARTIINTALRVSEIEELRERVQQLEDCIRVKREDDKLDAARRLQAP